MNNKSNYLRAAVSSIAVAGATILPGLAAASGADLYEENCSACHLENGAGDVDLMSPSIAGLDQEYILRQYSNVTTGIRVFTEDEAMAQGMVEIMAELSADDMNEISAYVAAMPIVAIEQEVGPIGFPDRGLYNNCSSCHGAKGQGASGLGAPRLAAQHSWYLKDQLMKFRDGTRGSHPDDTHGIQMRDMAVAIASDEDVDTIVNYIANFEPPSKDSNANAH
ncbi:c-type cytochrome [Ruegeria sp. 2012CJ41-6]|uniref:C-type cytochrome n=1 Tax=Ruegeria spongiae TaxID=2942209 RepID=A0ABT0PXY4_9RHOB|nr:c-type cytochrome [Ruegeria spongiae]MCL6282455.1 c-type cytochrome [Ruegeria spongiae]